MLVAHKCSGYIYIFVSFNLRIFFTELKVLESEDFRTDEILEITSSKHLEFAHEKTAAPIYMVLLKVTQL